MGMFSGSKEIIVSSTVYNMAGDEATRPNFLKNSLYGAVMSQWDRYIGEVIVGNYLVGPGMNQRNFLKWAERQNYIGLPTYSVSREKTVDVSVVGPEIPTPPTPSGLVISVQNAYSVMGDYEHFVEQWVLANHPDKYNTAYVSSLDSSNNLVTVQWFGGGSDTFTATGYDPGNAYIVAEYYHQIPSSVQSLVTGSTTTGDTTQPDLTGYGTEDSQTNTGVVNYVMNWDVRVVTTYTGVPTLPTDTDVTTPTNHDEGFNGIDWEYSKFTYEGGDGENPDTVSREHFLIFHEYREVYTDTSADPEVVNENTPAAGQTQTINTSYSGDHLRPVYTWRIDTQDTILEEVIGGVQIFSYEVGTGNATLDALHEDVSVTETQSEYFPFMPIRLRNKSITHADYDDITGSGLYEITNRAYRRASGGGQRFSQLVAEVEDNDDIGDIDYAFTHHGVAINVIEPACRRYIYSWLKYVSVHQTTGSGWRAAFATLIGTYNSAVTTMDAWIYAQGDSGRSGYGDPMPPKPSLQSPESTSVRLKCADAQLKNLDMRVSWTHINETLHSGAPTNPDTGLTAKKNEVWFVGGVDLTWTMFFGLGAEKESKDYTIENLEMYWQVDSGNYKKLTIDGLIHRNYVYGGESVKTPAKSGVADADPSGFIIPLHYPTVKLLGLKDATQMATANTLIVFNSYEIVKKKWYEGFLGMLIIIIVVVVVSVIFPPLGAAGGSGILGANAAVGAAIGLTGTAAIVAGAIINAVVAIAISQIISAGSIALFGDKWGAIIGTVINLAVSFGMSGGFEFDNLSELVNVENVMKITAAIANGYEGYTAGSIAEIADTMESNQEKYDKQMEEISDMLAKLNRNNDLNFDPLSLTDSVKGNDLSMAGGQYITETLEGFIHRTTMTGSDIVEINLDLINNFTALSLELPS